nr:endonuclease/exonuclease/phosphatase family protein [Hoyosella altamirensis]
MRSRWRALRWLVDLSAAAGIAVSGFAIILFSTDVQRDRAVALASFTPLLLITAFIALVIAIAGKRWVLATIAALVSVAGAAVIGPLFVASGASGAGAHSCAINLRVMQANLLFGTADLDALVQTAKERDADILTVQELTEEAGAGLERAGIDELLPYQLLRPSPGGGGAAIYSRLPLENGRSLDGFLPTNLTAEIEIGSRQPLVLYAVHPVPPFPRAARWHAEYETLAAELEAATAHEFVLVSGDFNATYFHKKYRDLLALGYEDAAASLGAGLMSTYPADKWYPALVGIDRIVTKGATATSLSRVKIPGSDHHGLVADVCVPPRAHADSG